jgi:16S rRNA A1518/A1519 N6-dimethyltransferase RsmA/KsgA/DIM1 with predicted DNA glycosylase/AP lyase activity
VLDRLEQPTTDNPLALAEFCKRAFAGRRKQLRGLLKSMNLGDLPLPEGVAPEARIESLSPIQISALERSARAR